MDQPESEHASQLFTVRVWLEEVAQEHTEWRGQLLHVNSGEVRYFRDWQTLIVRLLAMLPDVPPTSHEE
jgi:hypothetical protein